MSTRALLELDDRWARNMVTGLARIDGRAIGVIANQPRWLGGVIDAEAAEKGALFVDRCDRASDSRSSSSSTRPASCPARARRARASSATARSSCAPSRRRCPEAHRHPAQGVRRRRHHHELARPRRRHGVRLARGRDRHHGCAPGRGHHRTSHDRGRARSEPRRATSWPRSTPTSTSPPPTAAVSGFVDEVIEPEETRRRLAWALALLGGPR